MTLFRILFSVVFLGAINAMFGAGADFGRFRKPPVSHYPETWFHFISGNVSKDGITADLEAISAAGFQFPINPNFYINKVWKFA